MISSEPYKRVQELAAFSFADVVAVDGISIDCLLYTSDAADE